MAWKSEEKKVLDNCSEEWKSGRLAKEISPIVTVDS